MFVDLLLSIIIMSDPTRARSSTPLVEEGPTPTTCVESTNSSPLSKSSGSRPSRSRAKSSSRSSRSRSYKSRARSGNSNAPSDSQAKVNEPATPTFSLGLPSVDSNLSTIEIANVFSQFLFSTGLVQPTQVSKSTPSATVTSEYYNRAQTESGLPVIQGMGLRGQSEYSATLPKMSSARTLSESSELVSVVSGSSGLFWTVTCGSPSVFGASSVVLGS